MSQQEKINILLVDDQPNNLLALDAMLEDLGANLVKAESGPKALKALLDRDFAVVLLDVQMPGMDGFETANLIREREKSKFTPIIFVTALSRSETNVFRGYSLGAVDYLFKPIVPEILRSKVAVFVDLFRKTEEIKQQSREMARMSRQNELILSSAAEGVFGVNLDGVSMFVNPAAARMVAQPQEHLTGARVHELVHPTFGSNPVCDPVDCNVLRALREASAADVCDDLFYRSDGTQFPVDYSVTPLRDEAGEMIGSVFMFRDTTERRAAALASENERLYREAEAANKAKDDFLATLSHELRTPMTSILGWVQILRMGDIDPDTLASGLETIEGSARAQARLIDDMLDVSRIIMGKFQLDLQPIDIVSVIQSAMEALRPAADAKIVNLGFDQHIDSATVTGDPNRLQQVVLNLLSNAIKFTDPHGRIDVSLDSSDEQVEIMVRDTGQGIDPEFLPHVFERLRQASVKGHGGGLGLGLAIVHHIVSAHGGSIRAESEGAGEGSTFIVRLPISHDGGESEAGSPEGPSAGILAHVS